MYSVNYLQIFDFSFLPKSIVKKNRVANIFISFPLKFTNIALFTDLLDP
jgi:hypothetical protein